MRYIDNITTWADGAYAPNIDHISFFFENCSEHFARFSLSEMHGGLGGPPTQWALSVVGDYGKCLLCKALPRKATKVVAYSEVAF